MNVSLLFVYCYETFLLISAYIPVLESSSSAINRAILSYAYYFLDASFSVSLLLIYWYLVSSAFLADSLLLDFAVFLMYV